MVSEASAPLGSVEQTGVDARLLYPLVAELTADPRDGDFAWVALESRLTHWPMSRSPALTRPLS